MSLMTLPRRRPSFVVLVRKRALASAAALLLCPAAGIYAPPALAQINLPSLGDSVSEGLGVGTERRIGDQIMREIRVDPDYLDDPLLLEYIQQLWAPLMAAARQNGHIVPETNERFAWEIFLVRDRNVNAFALPGGFVGVHLGLIAMTTSRDELASVMAHELSHVTQRHVARRIASDSRQSMMALAGMLVGLLAAARSSSPDAANAVLVGSQAVAAQGQLNFSRDMEREADRVGYGLLTGAGFATSGMASMFEKLDQAYHLNDSGGYPYLRTHPMTSERIGDARERLATGPSVPPQSSLEHALMQARAKVLMDARAEAWQQLQALDAGVRQPGVGERLSALYASAFASMKMRNWPRAETALNSAQAVADLISGEPRVHRALSLLRAELALARAQPLQGQQALLPLAGDRSRPVVLQRVQLALAGDDRAQLQQSADTLQTWVTLDRHDALAWGLLAQLWERLDHPLRSVRAQAETRVALGDIVGAIDRLRSGIRLSRSREADQVEAAVLESRLRALLAARRQELQDLNPRREIPAGVDEPVTR
ncbi:M48 family metalloprotease [Roseateles toxinivorans]|uniref:Putative Zn-dependent protease n=1 Tax=Roseateles toxinivorans TaxID=270368 RepID=A0A4R6QQR7_9BURK|nr:M48 family metalloprotease [Roseateles toxinivorans]TDP73077.1 putative Zn-dependent protease [Roseateles toxinivorans]